MPSVQLSRLREQITQLLGRVDRPEEFRRSLRDVLEKNSEHAYRSGTEVSPRSLLPSYRVPTLVYRQLEIELTAASVRNPDQLIQVADTLLTDDHLEPRLLASQILGNLPPAFADEVILRIKNWAQPAQDRLVLEALIDDATKTLRVAAPEKFFDLIRLWLDDHRIEYSQIGLRSLEALIQDPKFEDIPPIFRLLSPLILAPSSQLLNNLHHCLRVLARKSPGETSYFLHQAIGSSTDIVTARLIRRVLPEFPETFQDGLRSALRSRSNVG